MCPITGPHFFRTVVTHYTLRGNICLNSFQDWIMNTGNEADVRVSWWGHDDTWESLEQSVEDIPTMIRKYVVYRSYIQIAQ